MIAITVDASEIHGFAEAMSAAPDLMRREMAVASRDLLTLGVDLAQEFAPVDRGELRDSIRILTGPTIEGGSYGTDKVYARMREHGGVIRARNKPYLVFRTRDGRWVKVKEVRQTGTRYMGRSADALAARAPDVYAAAVERVWDRIMAGGL